MDVGKLMRIRARGSPSWPGVCPKAGYVEADLSSHRRKKSLADGAGHTFFKIFDRSFGLRMMPRAGGELTIAQGTQFAAHRLFSDGDPKLLKHPLAQIDNAPPQDAMNRRDRTALDDPGQSSPMRIV